MGFFPTQVRSGIETIMELVQLDAAVKTADLVITGEGKMDEQTLAGKVIAGVQKLCAQHQKPLAVVCGVLELVQDQLQQFGVWQAYPLVRADTSMQEALAKPSELISKRVIEMIKAYHNE